MHYNYYIEKRLTNFIIKDIIMDEYSDYTMLNVKTPLESEYTTVYYYLKGKVVGERKAVDGRPVYYDLTGARCVTALSDIEFSVKESVVDSEAYKEARNTYNEIRNKRISAFKDMLVSTYNVTYGEVEYFYNAFYDNGLAYVENELSDFVDCRDKTL